MIRNVVAGKPRPGVSRVGVKEAAGTFAPVRVGIAPVRFGGRP